MWKNITDTIGNITTVAVQLIGLSVALEVVFGSNVPFLSLGVISNISSIVASLGSEGLVGLVTIAILCHFGLRSSSQLIIRKGASVPFFCVWNPYK